MSLLSLKELVTPWDATIVIERTSDTLRCHYCHYKNWWHLEMSLLSLKELVTPWDVTIVIERTSDTLRCHYSFSYTKSKFFQSNIITVVHWFWDRWSTERRNINCQSKILCKIWRNSDTFQSVFIWYVDIFLHFQQDSQMLSKLKTLLNLINYDVSLF